MATERFGSAGAADTRPRWPRPRSRDGRPALGAARIEFEAARVDAEWIGDALLEARSLTCPSIALRRLARVGEARDASERTIAVSPWLGLDAYVGVGRANRAWASLRTGALAAARADAQQADRLLASDAAFPFRRLALRRSSRSTPCL